MDVLTLLNLAMKALLHIKGKQGKKMRKKKATYTVTIDFYYGQFFWVISSNLGIVSGIVLGSRGPSWASMGVFAKRGRT